MTDEIEFEQYDCLRIDRENFSLLCCRNRILQTRSKRSMRIIREGKDEKVDEKKKK